MNKTIFCFALLILVILSGCVFEKELDTGENQCRATMTSIFAALGSSLVDADCANACKVNGYKYKQWKCSEKDTLVCVCSGW